MSKRYQYDATIAEKIVVGIFKALWFLIKLPFKGMAGRKGISVTERNEITSKRHEIENLLGSSSVIELKHAVMEADKLVDQVLKLKGYPGETFADRLKFAEKHLDWSLYQNIWEGHKIRNRIAHESETISFGELKSAIDKLLKYTKQI